MAAKFALLVPGFYKIGSKSTTLGLKSNMAKPISLCRLFRRHFEKIYPRAIRTNRGWSGPTVHCARKATGAATRTLISFWMAWSMAQIRTWDLPMLDFPTRTRYFCYCWSKSEEYAVCC